MEVVAGEEGGGGDGDGFVAGGEECPAVGGAFGDVEGLVGFEEVEDGEVVDVALRPLRKPKSRLAAGCEVAVLEADELVVL